MKKYNTRIDILLEPVGKPDVVVTCNGHRTELIVTEPIWVNFNYSSSAETHTLTVEHRNRHPHDGVTAVIVKAVKFNDIESPKFVYQGIYTPHNMEPRRTDYIDWNGIWVLEYTTPVYTWAHKTMNLGWIYM